VRLAVDIGGTFTDVALEDGRRRVTLKVLTTAAAPEEGVIEGVRNILGEADLAASDIATAIHGTTLATNALIERKGARTALVTTEGFRDVLETGYEKRFEQYDVFMDKPQPLVPRYLRFTVPERIAADGAIVDPLDEDAVAAVAQRLTDQNVEAVAVGFLHSYANPAHEETAGGILRRSLPDVAVTLSSQVSPEIREYDRFSTACANAYVQPLMAGYLMRLARLLEDEGLRCPLYFMMSGGGLTTLETAVRLPIRLVESGPAGGAILAGHIAHELGLAEALSYDMGGTTAKICLVRDGEAERSRAFEVARMYRDLKGSGLPVRIPVIEMVEIGAGGGSIARVDAMRRITVGPDSAGSEPGPASYGAGGARATVTDADLVLGRLDAARFAGGRIVLDEGAAARAVGSHVGAPLGMDVDWAAAGVSEIVEENMANAARVHAIERGRVIGRHTMIAFGGAAPLHAARLAERLGIRRVVVPAGAGVGSAIGFLRAPVSYQVVRSRYQRLSDFDLAGVNDLLAAMRAEAEGIVRAGAAALVESRSVDMRYLGQGHELAVDLPLRALEAKDLVALRRRFEALYEAQYKVVIPEIDVELLTWAVTVGSETPASPEPAVAAMESGDATDGARAVFEPTTGQREDTPLFWRPRLAAGTTLAGPAMIAEEQTTTVIPRGWDAAIDRRGYIVLERPDDAAAGAGRP
ncbi:MAG: hydantoinase/oxoprolinase family protein, partial [Alphaproteobacteria bacterium]